MAGDVLRRLALHALVQIAAVVQPLHFAQFLLGMRVKITALHVDRMAQQDTGGEARRQDSDILQQLHPLFESRVERHAAASPAWSSNSARCQVRWP